MSKETRDLGFGIIEVFDKDTQYAPAQSIKIGNTTDIREDLVHKQIAELQKQLEEKEKEIEDLKRKVNCAVDDLRNIGMRFELETFRANKLQDELKSQPSEIVEKINGEIYTRMVVECKETKYTDINLILNNILKEYQK